jgi:formylglycine-generating enzyme required for sulfatase activity
VTRALLALTSARLIIARDPPEGRKDATYELAHEALIQSWDQLRALLGRDAEKRALAQRVERAAEEWERLGKGSEGLWSRRQLREVEQFDGLAIGERERLFLAASRASARRRRAVAALVAVAVPGIFALVFLGARFRAQERSREEAAVRLGAAAAALSRARALDADEAALLPATFAQFDAGQTDEAERAWTRVRGLRARIEEELASARGSIEAALAVAPSGEARRLSADLIVFRLERERQNPLSRERKGLLDQLPPGDARRASFEQPARLRVEARASLRPLSEDGAPIVLEPGKEREITPGSWLLELPWGARLPLLLRFGDRQDLQIPAAAVPDGFIHVPAGRFLTGFDGDEDVRLGFFGAPPLHESETPAYLIARTETTFADWLVYLRTLPPKERVRRMPRAQTLRNALGLSQRPDGRFLLTMQPTTRTYQAFEGEPLVYPGRRRNASVDWRRFPVTGVSFEDARAYALWLSGTGRVPGARLCREEEWERAARGADGRSFPSGASIVGDDANIDETYGRDPLAFGPDPVGAHPRSDSPVGAADMAGNAWEMTRSRAGTPAIRGGSWYQGALTARSVNREPYEPTARDLLIGFRLCATVQ